MAHLYSGRRFSVQEEAVSAAQAFSDQGFLPLFAARATRRFRIVHPEGVGLERCLRCGAAASPVKRVCHSPCPLKTGEHRITKLFGIDLRSGEVGSHLLPVRLQLAPYRAQLFLAMIFVMDAAQDAVLKSPNPRLIALDDMVEDLAHMLEPQLQSDSPKMSGLAQ